ncbi:MAG: CoA transferase [Ruminococcaceae bacterium]|nr:CoA transferase [Oscillospiraceae bacterium]
MSLPLKGIRVIELSNYVAAPSATRILSALGATVIKIEAFGGDVWRNNCKANIQRGDEENPLFDMCNAGKSSICINIKDKDGFALLMRMLETADVFVTNTRSKSLKKLGLDGETLCARFPRLIYGVVNGYGDKGPDADTAGFDSMAFWVRSGFQLDMAEANLSSYPVCTPSGVGDCVAGCILVAGLMTALYNREKTGRGEIVKSSLYGAAVWTMGLMVIKAEAKYNKPFPMTREMEGALTSKYMCKDGQWFVLMALDYNRDAQKIYNILGIAEEVRALGVVDLMTKTKHNAELSAIFQRAFLAKNLDEWTALFKAADIVSGPMSHFRDVAEDEQAWANGFVEEYRFRNGETCVMPCQPVRLASVESKPTKFAPLPGEQTDEVLRAYGYSEEEILGLRARGAVQ